MTDEPDDVSTLRRTAAEGPGPALKTVAATARATAVPAQAPGEHAPPYTAFDRRELNEILRVYGRMVAAGEWRDYAIDHLADRAVFSIFRRSSEVPLYRIEKNPRLARRQGAYSVIAQTGLILKRGPDLARVLRVIDRSLTLAKA